MNNKEEEKKQNTCLYYSYMVALGNTWLYSCLLGCVVALWSICTLLICAGPVAGYSAVLAVRRYCGYRSLICAFVLWAEAGSKAKQEKEKKGKRGKQKNSLRIDPEKIISLLAITGWERLRRGSMYRRCPPKGSRDLIKFIAFARNSRSRIFVTAVNLCALDGS